MSIIQSSQTTMSSRSAPIYAHINTLEQAGDQPMLGHFTTANPNYQMQEVQQQAASLCRHYCAFLRRDIANIESIARAFKELDVALGNNA